MIALFKNNYKKSDFEYLHAILDELLVHKPLCDSDCVNCDKKEACRDLNNLHDYVNRRMIELE